MRKFSNILTKANKKKKEMCHFDGKVEKGSSRKDGKIKPLNVLNVFSSKYGICMEQKMIEEKTNEITAIPLLINSLELSGCIVTIDAMGCQKDITQTIIERDANYIIAIKENKKKNYQLAKQIIDDYQDRDEIINRVTRHVSENTGHGRVEKRTCTVVSYGSIMEKMFKKKLVGLKSVVGIKSERTIVAIGEYTQEVRYYVTSLDNTRPEKIASAIRQHWSIENNLHWQLDVTFREDYSKKVKNAARNFSVATKMALTILKNEKTTKGSMNLKRLKAGWMKTICHNFCRTIIFNASALQEELGYSSGW